MAGVRNMEGGWSLVIAHKVIAMKAVWSFFWPTLYLLYNEIKKTVTQYTVTLTQDQPEKHQIVAKTSVHT